MDLNTDKLPDFIVCGFQKCGTSALSQNLNQHSDISIARTSHVKANLSHGKEINYFSCVNPSTNHMGIRWYKSHFKNDGKLWGCCSPNYSMYEVDCVTDKMLEVLENTKFIFSIRNPIYRAFSAYNHYMQLYVNNNIKFGDWEIDKTFLENLKFYPHVFGKKYMETLKLYENKFGRDRMHITIQERLYSDIHEYNKMFKFLNIDNFHIINEEIHSRTYDRELSPVEINFLKKYYKDDVIELFDWLGYEIEEWKEFVK